MRIIAAPVLPAPDLHPELDELTRTLRELYAERLVVQTRASEVEAELAAESQLADIAQARAASEGKAAPAVTRRVHALTADGLEAAHALAVLTSAITSATSDLTQAVTVHGRAWATQVEDGALQRAKDEFTEAVQRLSDADLRLQSARQGVQYLRDGLPLQQVTGGLCWALMRPSGEAHSVREVLTELARYAVEEPPGRPGRLRFAGSRTA